MSFGLELVSVWPSEGPRDHLCSAFCVSPAQTTVHSTTRRLQGAPDNGTPAMAGKDGQKQCMSEEDEVDLAKMQKNNVRTRVLTEEIALEIFKRRPKAGERSGTCTRLAQKYGVTTTAIRHIWDLQTWKCTTMPLWTPEELASSVQHGLCQACKEKGVQCLTQACPECPCNRKRGRPAGAKDSYKRKRGSGQDDSPRTHNPAGKCSGRKLLAGAETKRETRPVCDRGEESTTLQAMANPQWCGTKYRAQHGSVVVSSKRLVVQSACSTLIHSLASPTCILGQPLAMFLHPAYAQNVIMAALASLEDCNGSTGIACQVSLDNFILPILSCHAGLYMV